MVCYGLFFVCDIFAISISRQGKNVANGEESSGHHSVERRIAMVFPMLFIFSFALLLLSFVPRLYTWKNQNGVCLLHMLFQI